MRDFFRFLQSIPVVVVGLATWSPATIPAAQAASITYLKASNTNTLDAFGAVLAISGDTAVVGAPQEDSAATGVNGNQTSNTAPDSGAAYVFVRRDGAWTQQAYLKASNTGAGDKFGFSVAISGDTIAIGAFEEDSAASGVNGNGANNSGNGVGAVYVFTRTTDTWSQQAYLKPGNPHNHLAFGWSLALEGNTLVVGAPGESSIASNSGGAYIFTRSGSTWSQQALLKAGNAAGNTAFGLSVALSGSTVAVGSPGERSNARGVNGDFRNTSSIGAGAVYVFTRSGTNWAHTTAYLKASNTVPSSNGLKAESFGFSVAISGDRIAVGAPGEDSSAQGVNGREDLLATEDSGAVYIFRRALGTWSQESYVKASNSHAELGFGLSLRLEGNSLLVGGPGEGSNAQGLDGDPANSLAANSGAAYFFSLSGPDWNQTAYLKAPNSYGGILFGTSVALSGNTLAASAPIEKSAATGVNGNQSNRTLSSAGAAYIFSDLPTTSTPRLLIRGETGAALVNAKSELGFGSHFVGQTGAARSLTLQNIGSGRLTISDIKIAGPNSADFTYSGIVFPLHLAAGAAMNFEVVFKAGGGGQRSANLSIVSSAQDSPFNLKLSGTGNTAHQTDQKITFAQPADLTYGAAPLALAAAASSGLPVTFQLASTVPAAGVATLGSDQKTLTILGAGQIVVRATQPGNDTYKPALAVTRTITVNKAPLAVTFDSVSRLVRTANPVFPPLYSGFVNGDTAADLASTRPVGKATAILASPEGKYPITFTGGLDANYRFVAGAPAWVTVQGFSGAYEALLVDDSGTARGKLELLVPKDALTYSGTLNLSSLPAAIPIRGNLSASDGASAQASWTPAANAGITGLSLGFELTGDTLDGQLSFTGASPANLSIASGSRVFVQPVVSGKKQNAPWTGLHTLVLRDPTPLMESDTRALPLGAGHASVSVAPTGVMTFKGKLADGTALTGTARPASVVDPVSTSPGLFRVFLRPYAQRLHSFLSGELLLETHPDQTRFPNRFRVDDGILSWAKAASPAKPLDPSYRAGFSATVSAALDPWLPPRAASASAQALTLPERLGLLAPGSGTDAPFDLEFLGGFLSNPEIASLPSSLTLRANGLIVLPSPNPRSFQFTVTPATGALSGSFLLSNQVAPPPAKPIIRKGTISGTFRQGPAGSSDTLGHAHYLLDPIPGDSGSFSNELVSGELILTK